ncbi:hypothetical protein HAX54_040440, partial [Datura stramonium]|nr:hypothetical protein [Datura stramonium]
KDSSEFRGLNPLSGMFWKCWAQLKFSTITLASDYEIGFAPARGGSQVQREGSWSGSTPAWVFPQGFESQGYGMENGDLEVDLQSFFMKFEILTL